MIFFLALFNGMKYVGIENISSKAHTMEYMYLSYIHLHQWNNIIVNAVKKYFHNNKENAATSRGITNKEKNRSNKIIYPNSYYVRVIMFHYGFLKRFILFKNFASTHSLFPFIFFHSCLCASWWYQHLILPLRVGGVGLTSRFKYLYMLQITHK